ncbi:MAG TPA: LCP family protein [Micromonosporaceae bacterium]|nr:LCP family protein [Micromonosporaceae bacterium]
MQVATSHSPHASRRTAAGPPGPGRAGPVGPPQPVKGWFGEATPAAGGLAPPAWQPEHAGRAEPVWADDPQPPEPAWADHTQPPEPVWADGTQPPERARRDRGERSRRSRPVSRRRDPLWARLAVVAGALLMMVSGGALAGGRVLLGQAVNDLTTANLIQGDAGAGSNISGAINMLLVGIDARPPGSSETNVLADTIVVLHVPASHDQAYLISIPRDTRVTIPAYPATQYPGSTEKINSAFSYGYRGEGSELERRARGVDLLARTINRMSGIRFNGAALIDFSGFEAVVRELGGVYLCVDQKAQSIHLAENDAGKVLRVWYDEAAGRVRGIPPGYHVVVHQPGCRRMTPEKALDYSRIRYGLPNGDYDRQRHQQQLIKAIVKEATSKGVITDRDKLSRVIKAAGKAFILDTQGVDIADFIFTLKGVAANDLVLIKTNAGTFHSLSGATSYQALSEESMQMLAAARDGRLLDFLATHPHFVAAS